MTTAESLPRVKPPRKRAVQTPEYLPTLEEIAALTAEIRAGWSPREFERRAVGPQRVAWEVPGTGGGGEAPLRPSQTLTECRPVGVCSF